MHTHTHTHGYHLLIGIHFLLESILHGTPWLPTVIEPLIHKSVDNCHSGIIFPTQCSSLNFIISFSWILFSFCKCRSLNFFSQKGHIGIQCSKVFLFDLLGVHKILGSKQYSMGTWKALFQYLIESNIADEEFEATWCLSCSRRLVSPLPET